MQLGRAVILLTLLLACERPPAPADDTDPPTDTDTPADTDTPPDTFPVDPPPVPGVCRLEDFAEVLVTYTAPGTSCFYHQLFLLPCGWWWPYDATTHGGGGADMGWVFDGDDGSVWSVGTSGTAIIPWDLDPFFTRDSGDPPFAQGDRGTTDCPDPLDPPWTYPYPLPED